LLELLPDPLLFLPLVDLPALSLLVDLELVLLHDLLLLEFEVTVNLFDGASEVLLQELSLLFKVLVNLRLDQGVFMLGEKRVRPGP